MPDVSAIAEKIEEENFLRIASDSRFCFQEKNSPVFRLFSYLLIKISLEFQQICKSSNEKLILYKPNRVVCPVNSLFERKAITIVLLTKNLFIEFDRIIESSALFARQARVCKD